MNTEQIKLLIKMKNLIRQGKRKFEDRSDRDYMQELLNLGITEEEAWKEILMLNVNFYFLDPKPSYNRNNKCLIFKKPINGKLAYIKLVLEEIDEEIVVCLSFHKDTKGGNN